MLSKINYPIAIIIGALILGGAYMYSENQKSLSIERQLQMKLEQDRQVEQLKIDKEKEVEQLKIDEAKRQEARDLEKSENMAATKRRCVIQAQKEAVDLFKSQHSCSDPNPFYEKECNNGTYNVTQYDRAYKDCLTFNGID